MKKILKRGWRLFRNLSFPSSTCWLDGWDGGLMSGKLSVSGEIAFYADGSRYGLGVVYPVRLLRGCVSDARDYADRRGNV